MKFEANIPSYLKTGSGSFPVGDTGASKRKKPTNFYEQAQQGFEMSATTEDTQTLYTPQGMTSKIEPNFFQTMPRLRHIVEVTNPKTKVKSEVTIEGLQSFLV